MLLTIDVGNSNTVLGVFRGEELIANWRLTTAKQQTIDEYGVLTRNLFTLAGLDCDAIGGVIISSVVPPVNWTLAEMSRIYFGQKALFVEAGVKTGMAVLVDNPLEVGADRIVNGVAAFHKYGGPCIVVDFGTAITFDAISARGEYLGGVIAPGLGIASEALFAQGGEIATRGDKRSGQSHRHEYRHAHAGGALLWRGGHGGRDAYEDESGARRQCESGGDGRAGEIGSQGIEADSGDG